MKFKYHLLIALCILSSIIYLNLPEGKPIPDGARDFSRLKSIGTAIAIYQSDNSEQFPESLDMLISDQALNPEIQFSCITRKKFNYIKPKDTESIIPVITHDITGKFGCKIIVYSNGNYKRIDSAPNKSLKTELLGQKQP